MAPSHHAVAAVAALGTALGAWGALPTRDDPVPAQVVLTYTDRDITESSGLVARRDVVATVNDSGSEPIVYAVERRTGDTVGTVRYADAVTDVEALAPGRHETVWVGDLGDNRHARASVQLYRVPLSEVRGERTVDAASFGLVYPDGAHDAEALLVHPRTGQVLVVSKQLTGGTVYAAPRHLDPDTTNRLRAVGRVPGLVTDGAFFGDGKHLVLRTYGTAAVYTWPGLDRDGTFALPAQEQGEAVAVSPDGEVLIGTEGAYTQVLRIALPPAVARAVGVAAPDRPVASPAPSPTSPAPAARSAAEAPDDRLSLEEDSSVWLAGGGLAAVLAGWFYLTVVRRRNRRRS
jgi:hypothetical protein